MEEELNLSPAPTPETIGGMIRNMVGLSLYTLSLKIMPVETASWLLSQAIVLAADAADIESL